jgi:hypothetical protein
MHPIVTAPDDKGAWTFLESYLIRETNVLGEKPAQMPLHST